jgi:hypothetical protein
MPNALDNAYSEISNRLGPYDDKDRDYPVLDLPVTDSWSGLDELESGDHLRPFNDRFPVSQAELGDEDRRLVDGGPAANDEKT